MTLLETTIRIDASPDQVWAVLSRLDALHEYDPGVRKSEVVSDTATGVGSARRCDLVPRGWFKERVVEWQPNESIAFELFECTLPVQRLKHVYTITHDGTGTVVLQRMEYELKYGPLGKLMDTLMVRRKWRAGIQGFLSGLQQYVETGRCP